MVNKLNLKKKVNYPECKIKIDLRCCSQYGQGSSLVFRPNSHTKAKEVSEEEEEAFHTCRRGRWPPLSQTLQIGLMFLRKTCQSVTQEQQYSSMHARVLLALYDRTIEHLFL